MTAPLCIDVHTHLFQGKDAPVEAEMDEVVRNTTRYGIHRCVNLGNLRLGEPSFERPSPESIRVINDHTLKAVKRHPDLYIGFCYLNPANPLSSILEEMEHCVVEGGMRGLKFETSVLADDPLYDPILARAAELKIAVLHHAWYQMTGTPKYESTPAQIAHLARRHPKVPIIMAHLGGARERGVLDLIDCENVAIDTSGSFPESNSVEYAVKLLGPRRVVFGSDRPCRDFAVQKARIMGAEISAEARNLILGGNAARILRLEGVLS